MHVETIKEVVRILTGNGETNKEFQSCILGYVLGLEAPIGLNTEMADDKVEWATFFNDIPGEINEHFLLNLNLAQEVADLTLKYRQEVMAGGDNIEELAQRFLTLTGAAFGLLGNEGTVKLIRKALRTPVEKSRTSMESRRELRRLKAEEKQSISKEGFWDTVKTIADRILSDKYEFNIIPLEVGNIGVAFQIRGGKYNKPRNVKQFAMELIKDLSANKSNVIGTYNDPMRKDDNDVSIRLPNEAELPSTNLNQIALQLLRDKTSTWR